MTGIYENHIIADTKSEISTAIYIHIPFCKKKCKYCDFVSFDSCEEEIKDRYIDCLIKEIQNCKLNRKIDTIYIGGGTPSVICSEKIAQIMNEIYRNFDIAPNCEMTIEVNPGTVDIEKLKKYKEIGINRLSIGLQSTNDRLLELLGRVHKYNDFKKVYNDARLVGFENINVDLMLGLPTQSLEELQQSVNDLMGLNPEHISIYSLILEEGTELERMVSNKEIEMLSDEIERKMYWNVKNLLEQNGYNHYEISNFSKKGYESKHNLGCWNQEEYIGFGVASHSYIDKKRFCHTSNIYEYLSNPETVITQEIQNFEGKAKEYMMLGLRKLDGISISKFEQKFKINPLFYFRFEISNLVEKDLIEVDLDNVKLTEKGINFANIVFEQFV